MIDSMDQELNMYDYKALDRDRNVEEILRAPYNKAYLDHDKSAWAKLPKYQGRRPTPLEDKNLDFPLFWRIKIKLGGVGSMYNRPPGRSGQLRL